MPTSLKEERGTQRVDYTGSYLTSNGFSTVKAKFPFQSKGLTFFSISCGMLEVRTTTEKCRGDAKRRLSVETCDVRLHNITDVIFGIRYPVSATHTR